MITVHLILLFVYFLSNVHALKVVTVDTKLYLIINGKSKLIPDNETVSFLGFKLDEIERISQSIFELFEPADPVDSMIRRDSSPDEALRIWAAKFKTLQDNNNLVKDSVYIYWTSNPALLYWKGRYLSTSREVRNEIIRFAWFDEKFQFIDNSSYYGVGPGYTFLQIPRGADARMLLLGENRLLLVYGHMNGYRVVRERLVELSVHNDTGLLTPDSQHRLMPVFYNGVGSTIQKNWVPFNYNGTIYFVETINPFRVLKSQTVVDGPSPVGNTDGVETEDNELEAEIFSHTWETKLDWDYGGLRGGTPAKLIGDNEYLMFFHSRRTLPYNTLITYFMGALTFSAQPPFIIKTISRVPMYHGRFYDGAWGEIHHFDYVLFPMHFFLASSTDAGPGGMAGGALANVTEDSITGPCGPECLASHDVILSCGHQDRDGWVHRINLAELYKTMVPVPPPPLEQPT